jgi:hypothetical protein
MLSFEGGEMHTIVVHPNDAQADAASVTQALKRAKAGDVVLVQPGRYSPTLTGEQLPLVVPAEVSLIGVDQASCCIDGDGHFAPSFNPISPGLSVMTLGYQAVVSHLTVTNGGGHGIAVPPGASATIHHCTISQHGDHGVYLCGVAEAVVTKCDFATNGRQRFEPSLPRGVGARQGHHVFAEARGGQRNRITITDNTMRECFADGLAFICFFSEPDAVSFEALVQRNTIEGSERGGLLFCGSFGPARNQLRLMITDNILRNNKQFGLSIIGAFPLGEKVPRETRVDAVVSGNAITSSPIGMLVQGAVGEAQQNTSHLTIEHNHIADCQKNAMRIVGAMGMDGVKTSHNSLATTLAWNSCSGNLPLIVAQGAGGVATGGVTDNHVSCHFLSGPLPVTSEGTCIVSDGLVGNHADVPVGGNGWTRKGGNVLS